MQWFGVSGLGGGGEAGTGGDGDGSGIGGGCGGSGGGGARFFVRGARLVVLCTSSVKTMGCVYLTCI